MTSSGEPPSAPAGPGPEWTPPPAPPPGPPPPYAPNYQQYPPQYSPYAPQQYPPPRPTNALAIVSLVAGCAQFFVWFVGAIVAIVTGHIARRQIRRSGENGDGLAIGGLVLGYVGLVASALLLVMFIALFAAASHLAPKIATSVQRDQAITFLDDVDSAAAARTSTPRDAAAIAAAATGVNSRENNATFVLPDGTPLAGATNADFARNGWRIEMRSNVPFTTDPVCIVIPPTVGAARTVYDGHCPATGSGQTPTS